MARSEGTTNIQQFIEKHSAEIEALKNQLAVNFDVPAQRLINFAFVLMNVERFTRSGDDLWEMIVAHQNGWEYTKPPAHLAQRWAQY